MGQHIPVAVVTVHGMGTHRSDHDAGFIQTLRSRFKNDQIIMRPCVWSDVTEAFQKTIFEKTTGAARYTKVREFVLSGLGDATSYLGGTFSPQNPAKATVYREVHDRLAQTLREIEASIKKLGHDPLDVPLVVLAHSLGSTIVSNYIWDLNKSSAGSVAGTEFMRMKTLAVLITYGSTLPLFVPKPVNNDTLKCIAFPPGERFEMVAHWDNIYSPFDILGWPIQKLWGKDGIPKHGPEDIPMAVGRPLLQRYTPLSHQHYTNSRKFVNHVEGRIREVMQFAQSTPLS